LTASVLVPRSQATIGGSRVQNQPTNFQLPSSPSIPPLDFIETSLLETGENDDLPTWDSRKEGVYNPFLDGVSGSVEDLWVVFCKIVDI